MGLYDEYCLWAQVAVLLMLGLYCTFGIGICRYCTWVELSVTKDSAQFSDVALGNTTFTYIPRVDG